VKQAHADEIGQERDAAAAKVFERMVRVRVVVEVRSS